MSVMSFIRDHPRLIIFVFATSVACSVKLGYRSEVVYENEMNNALVQRRQKQALKYSKRNEDPFVEK